MDRDFHHYSDMCMLTIKRKGLIWLSLWGVLVYDLVYGVLDGKGWSGAVHKPGKRAEGKGRIVTVPSNDMPPVT